MKLLDNAVLSRITAAISGFHGNNRLYCRLESYSCKMAGEDKRLYKQISSSHDGRPADEMEILTPVSMSFSPGSYPEAILHDTCSWKTLYYLKATLNAAFAPDYDFSSAKSQEFSKEPSLELVARNVNGQLYAAMGDEYLQVKDALWGALYSEIITTDCEIYSYTPDMQSDPFSEEGCLWSFDYFFYNKKMKRMVFFTCKALAPNTPHEDEDEDDIIFHTDESMEF